MYVWLTIFFVVSLTFQSTVSLLVVPVLAAISVQCAEEDAASSYEPNKNQNMNFIRKNKERKRVEYPY